MTLKERLEAATRPARGEDMLSCFIMDWTPSIKKVLELGSSTGVGAAMMLKHLPADGTLVSVNLPAESKWPRRYAPCLEGPFEEYPDRDCSGDDVGSFVLPRYGSDPRFRLILGSTLNVSQRVGTDFDMLFIDSHHWADYARKEWELYKHVLKDGALVVVDDIKMQTMPEFWDWIPYEKYDPTFGGFGRGIFIFDRKI